MNPLHWVQDSRLAPGKGKAGPGDVFSVYMQMTAANIWIVDSAGKRIVLQGTQLCPGSLAAQKGHNSF